MRWLILLTLILVLAGCVTPVQAPQPDPSKPVHYMIPLDARNQDYVCAQTLAALPDRCRTIQAFRMWMMDARAN